MNAHLRRGMRRFYTVLFLVGGAVTIVVLALLNPVVGTATDFSIYNTGWNGASRLGADVYQSGAFVPAFRVSLDADDVRVSHTSFTEFDLDPGSSSLFIIGPDSPFTQADGEWGRDFLERGGLVVLADDFGTGNEFLEAVGAGSRFDGRPLMDLAFSKRPAFIVALDFQPHPLTRNVTNVLLNYPTAIQAGPRATELAWTVNASWLDTNGNMLKDENTDGPHAFLAVEPVGQGFIVLLSEPSLLINGQRELGDAERLVSNLIAYATQGRNHVLIDESHRDYFDPVAFMGASLRDLAPGERSILAGVAFVGFLVYATDAAPLAWRRGRVVLAQVISRVLPPETEDEESRLARALARVRERHPDWDETVLTEIDHRWRAPHE